MLRKVVKLFSSPTRPTEPRASQLPQRTPSPRPASLHSTSDAEESTQDLLDQQLRATEQTLLSAQTPAFTLPSGNVIHFTEVLAYIEANPNTPKLERAQLIDFSKTQIAKLETGLESLAAKVKEYDEKECENP
ncbi:hypothetical protein BHYA_1755g00010 [Botrytis hyacinthi]|uniref:Uncharacterized protein n=1 Tax=Botrytis hyacinthi TaxID=278943 RepID=A0A4Z1GB63_9HELO|nr:hypothetical protein BHYA_1755g00010 [Botrytis hyacinthi]